MSNPENAIERVFAAAVTNKEFKKRLLDPKTRASALAERYKGKPFGLSQEESNKLLMISRKEEFFEFAKDYIESPFPNLLP